MSSSQDEVFDLFVSYAHADDSDGWVAQLVDVLVEVRNRWDYRPWQQFFDRKAIRPGHDWEQRLARVGSAGALLVLLSPAYFRSAWCQKEWARFREQEQQTGQDQRVFFVYLETDEAFERADPSKTAASPEEAWRLDLKRRQYVDLRPWFGRGKWWRRLCAALGLSARRHRVWELASVREELEKLERAIHDRLRDHAHAQQARRLGVPYQSLPRPEYFVPRPEHLEQLRQAVLAADGEAGVVVSALFGLGGVGKSTLAAALADDPEVRRHFEDGILWATLGQQPEVQGLLMSWVRALGDHQFQAGDAASAREHLRQLLRERHMLLVLDDAWATEVINQFRVGGPRCRVLITTREGAIAGDIGARLFPLDVMSPEQALTLLTRRLGRPLRPDEQGPGSDLVEAVGRLPLAVELVAAQAADGVALAELLADLRQEVARLESLDRPGADEAESEAVLKQRSLRASVALSLARLKVERRERFAWLGVTPEDAVLNPRMAAVLWGTDERRARDELVVLRKKALLLAAPAVRVGGAELLAFRLHDMLHDSARGLLTAPREPVEPGALPGLGLSWPEAHAELLRRYRGRTRDGKWHTLPADGYIHGRLGWHLEKAGAEDELHALLREETPEGRNGWFEANERLGQSAVFADDVARAWRLAKGASVDGGGTPGVALPCRYALVTASLNSLAGNLSPGLLVALVRQGLWTVEQALAYARRIPAPERRVKALVALGLQQEPGVRGAVLAEALQAARAIGDEGARSRALAALAPHLPEGLLAEALQAARAIGDEGARSGALAALAPHLATLPRPDLARLWAETLPVLAARTRRGPLAELRSLTPVLVALEGRNAPTELGETAQAISDVGRWWP
jgi:hypothetical protein